MEYLEGETLAARVKRGALPIDQALKTAIEIGGAVDQARRSDRALANPSASSSAVKGPCSRSHSAMPRRPASLAMTFVSLRGAHRGTKQSPSTLNRCRLRPITPSPLLLTSRSDIVCRYG